MAERDPDELFQSFVRGGDVDALGELFDVAAPQLARVAWHLTHDAVEVEDLVQATFLTALGAAREFDLARPVVPWLLGILANHACNARRAAGRKPESLEVEPAISSAPESDLERRELQDAVHHAVAELPETYRDVISKWLLDGSSPSEIASATGKPASTVRVQLRRGLELLRQSLPAGAAAWAANASLGASLARARAEVLAHASRMAPVATTSSLAAAGGLLMALKWIVAPAALLAVVGGIVWWSRHESAQIRAGVEAPAPREVARAADAAEPEPLALERSEAGTVVSVAATTAVQSSSSAAPGWWLLGTAKGVPEESVARVSTDSAGGFEREVRGSRFELDVSPLFEDRKLAPRRFIVRYDNADFVPTFAQVDVAAQIDLDLAYAAPRVELRAEFLPKRATLVVTGRVVPPSGFDAADALVGLYSFDAAGKISDRASESVRCGADGVFRLRSSESGQHALAAVLPRLHPTTVAIDPSRGHSIELGEVHFDRGEHLAGKFDLRPSDLKVTRLMLSQNGGRMLDAPNIHRPRGAWGNLGNCPLSWVDGRFEFALPICDFVEGGGFRVEGLAPRDYELTLVTSGERKTESLVETVGVFDNSVQTIVHPTRDDLVLVVHRNLLRVEPWSQGAPLLGVGLSVQVGGASSVVDESEQPAIDLCWSGELPATVRLEKSGYSPVEFTVQPAEALGGTRRVELARGAESFDVVFRPLLRCRSSGVPARVLLHRLDVRSERWAGDLTREFDLGDSNWRISDVVPGRYQVHVDLGEAKDNTCLGIDFQRDLRADSGPIELVFESGGHFALQIAGQFDGKRRATLLDANGSEVRLLVSCFDPAVGFSHRIASPWLDLPANARVESLRPLAPGNYTLVVTANDDSARRWEKAVTIGGEETTEIALDLGSK